MGDTDRRGEFWLSDNSFTTIRNNLNSLKMFGWTQETSQQQQQQLLLYSIPQNNLNSLMTIDHLEIIQSYTHQQSPSKY